MDLADAAAKDPAAKDAASRLAAAEAWMKAADAIPEPREPDRELLKRRALLWYDKALPDLDDKDDELVKDRVAKLCKTFPDFAKVWSDFDTSKCEVVGNYCLRLKPGQTLTQKESASGTLAVEFVARCTKPRQKFELLPGPPRT